MAKPYFVNIDGQQVFTADFVFQQMQCQGSRIDRANSIAIISAIIAAASLLSCLYLLCR